MIYLCTCRGKAICSGIFVFTFFLIMVSMGMEQPMTLKIPVSCNEDWENMTPAGKGRFCNACSKEVTDFTVMNNNEIIAYFSRADQRQVCGRFHPYQLDRPLQQFQMEHRPLSKWARWKKTFVMAVSGFVLMLASCNRRSDVKGQVNGNPIVLDSNYTKKGTDTITNHIDPPRRESHVKMGKTKIEPEMLTGEVVIEPESVQGGVVPFQPEPVELADTLRIKK